MLHVRVAAAAVGVLSVLAAGAVRAAVRAVLRLCRLAGQGAGAFVRYMGAIDAGFGDVGENGNLYLCGEG